MRYFYALLLTTALLVTSVGCDNSDQPNAEKSQNKDSTEADVKSEDATAAEDAQEEAAYEGAAEKTLRGFGTTIDGWYESAKAKGGDLNDKSKSMLEAAKAKKDAAMAKLVELKDKSGDAWKDAKPHLDEAMKDLEAATKAAAANFTDDEAPPAEADGESDC